MIGRLKAACLITFFAVASFALYPSVAEATYSIVATDSASGQVGGSGTSCVGSLNVLIIYGPAPGHGAVHAQARVYPSGRDEAVRLLELDTPPDEIIAAITDPSFDRGEVEERQYGIVDLAGRSAGFTGSSTMPWSGDLQGVDGALTYSIQGNILTSEAVLDQAEEGFLAEGCDLADRLMLALEAGGQNGEGDSRCTPDGIPSDSAFIHVDLLDETVLVHLFVIDTSPLNPLENLRELYDAWRLENPCPSPSEPEPEAPELVEEDFEHEAEREALPEPADLVEGDVSTDVSADDGPAMDAAEDGEGSEAESGCGCSLVL